VRIFLRPEKNVSYDLCGMDFVAGQYYVGAAAFINQRYDTDRFITAVKKIIELHPCIGCTLVKTEAGHALAPSPDTGFSIEIVNVDHECPPFGDGIDVPDGLIPQQIPSPFGAPLVALRLTQFTDRTVIGTMTSHLMGDRTGFGMWWSDLHRVYSGGEPLWTPQHDRYFAHLRAESPSDISALAVKDEVRWLEKPTARKLMITDDRFIELKAGAARLSVGAHTLIRSLLIKALDPSTVFVSYDARGVAGSIVAENYSGNAVLHYVIKPELTVDGIMLQLDNDRQPDAADVERDIGWVQNQYRSTELAFGCFVPGCNPPTNETTLTLNSSIGSRIREVEWVEYMKDIPAVNTIFLYKVKGGYTAYVILSERQMPEFISRFEALLTAYSVS